MNVDAAKPICGDVLLTIEREWLGRCELAPGHTGNHEIVYTNFIKPNALGQAVPALIHGSIRWPQKAIGE